VSVKLKDEYKLGPIPTNHKISRKSSHSSVTSIKLNLYHTDKMTTNPQTNPSHEIPSHLNELKKAAVIFVIGKFATHLSLVQQQAI